MHIRVTQLYKVPYEQQSHSAAVITVNYQDILLVPLPHLMEQPSLTLALTLPCRNLHVILLRWEWNVTLYKH